MVKLSHAADVQCTPVTRRHTTYDTVYYDTAQVSFTGGDDAEFLLSQSELQLQSWRPRSRLPLIQSYTVDVISSILPLGRIPLDSDWRKQTRCAAKLEGGLACTPLARVSVGLAVKTRRAHLCSAQASLGDLTRTTITIIDDDLPGKLSFENEELIVEDRGLARACLKNPGDACQQYRGSCPHGAARCGTRSVRAACIPCYSRVANRTKHGSTYRRFESMVCQLVHASLSYLAGPPPVSDAAYSSCIKML